MTDMMRKLIVCVLFSLLALLIVRTVRAWQTPPTQEIVIRHKIEGASRQLGQPV